MPLILAWALSIHKSQGQTLEHVRVNLDRTFEKGQGAWQLSCAGSVGIVNSSSSLCRVIARNAYGDVGGHQLRLLQVCVPDISLCSHLTALCSNRVRAHPRVLEWMSEHMQMPELPYIRDESDEEFAS